MCTSTLRRIRAFRGDVLGARTRIAPLLLLAACGRPATPSGATTPRSQPTAARAPSPDAPPAPRELRALFKLAYVDSQVSSCSQTFDISSTRGTVTLDLRAAPVATLTVESAHRSVGRSQGDPYRYAFQPERCRWNGVATREGSGLRLELVLERDAPHRCSSELRPDRPPIRDLSLACASRQTEVALPGPPARTRHLTVLACAPRGRISHAIAQVSWDGAIPLAREPGLQLTRTDDQSLIGGEHRAWLQLLPPAQAPEGPN